MQLACQSQAPGKAGIFGNLRRSRVKACVDGGALARGVKTRAHYLQPHIVLAAYIAGVEAARNRRVGGAFDDGAAVGKEGNLIGLLPELQHEGVVADLA